MEETSDTREVAYGYAMRGTLLQYCTDHAASSD